MHDAHSLVPDARFELEKARSRLARGADPVEVLEAFSRSLTNKLLHPAIEAIKRSA
jgi:glutamyl-tRNA reductase